MFLPDPFSANRAARFYRTGDQARYRSDGNVEFLGRIDRQVKLRGFRIELGEIEATLRRQPEVADAVVTLREDRPGDKRLVAYLVSYGTLLDVGALRAALRSALPSYMVPSALVSLDALPLTTNGKLDRSSLPIPEDMRSAAIHGTVAPQDNLERHLVAIWERVLGVHPIGIADNFFDLGGHSLLAVQLFERIARHYGRRLPLGILFERGTIKELAVLIRQDQSASDRVAAVAIQPLGNKPPFFCAYPYHGLILCYRHLARYLGPDQPVYGLQPPTTDLGELAGIRVEDMAACCVHQIRAVQPRGPYYLGGYCSGGILASEIAHQLQVQGETVALLVLFDTYWPPGEVSVQVPLRLRLRYHASLWLDLRFRDKPAYAYARLKAIGSRIRGIYHRRRAAAVTRYPAPETEATPVWRSYVPRRYSGHVTLFCNSREPLIVDGIPDPALELATVRGRWT